MSWLFPYVRVASKLLQAFSSSETGQRTADAISRGATEAKVAGAHISSASEKAALTHRARRVVAQLREQLDAGAISEDEFLTRAHSVVAKTGVSVAAVDESLAARLAAYGKGRTGRVGDSQSIRQNDPAAPEWAYWRCDCGGYLSLTMRSCPHCGVAPTSENCTRV